MPSLLDLAFPPHPPPCPHNIDEDGLSSQEQAKFVVYANIHYHYLVSGCVSVLTTGRCVRSFFGSYLDFGPLVTQSYADTVGGERRFTHSTNLMPPALVYADTVGGGDGINSLN